ncbi:RsmE family RNA methyltransferase [Niabella drilacis]|uniref:Ribosomal RNA small subunit methyltransferase E n=1 Tax=Niabella drilacis (strain DSM 25811 / CCM 8410 / CCUG 62505 / LMG 26954 / E90) TaxID=1285928 RepID=A0A1G6IPP1_NIADE|nr:RsmE family RNA methyltransferase [Niabella drilacis]SDC08469.1 16S rRNA (uracil1498-N3)-methyltransferase [Niabella drilacis]
MPVLQLPFFYISEYIPGEKNIILDENNSRHVVQVLRMQTGEALHLTDGKGHLLTAEIADPHKKHCGVSITNTAFLEPCYPRITIAISLLKNANRFEWFLEKATEIGVASIVPLVSERTEKDRAKTERLQQILISALLQSRQVWLPQMPEPVKYTDFIKDRGFQAIPRKFIAHCLEEEKYSLKDRQVDADCIILIGPEGDFTTEEIGAALANGYQPVTLGATRLRTETAGVVAAALLCVR